MLALAVLCLVLLGASAITRPINPPDPPGPPVPPLPPAPYQTRPAPPAKSGKKAAHQSGAVSPRLAMLVAELAKGKSSAKFFAAYQQAVKDGATETAAVLKQQGELLQEQEQLQANAQQVAAEMINRSVTGDVPGPDGMTSLKGLGDLTKMEIESIERSVGRRNLRSPAVEGLGAMTPKHGRPTQCSTSSSWTGSALKLFSKGFTAGFNALVPGSGKIVGPLADEAISATKDLSAVEFAKWLNVADNDTVVLFAIGALKKQIEKHFNDDGKPADKYGKWLVRAGCHYAGVMGEAAPAAAMAFRWNLEFYGATIIARPCVTEQILQAIAIRYYGGKDVVPVLMKALKRKRAAGESAGQWKDSVVAAIEQYRALMAPHEPSITPTADHPLKDEAPGVA